MRILVKYFLRLYGECHITWILTDIICKNDLVKLNPPLGHLQEGTKTPAAGPSEARENPPCRNSFPSEKLLFCSSHFCI